MMPDLPNVGLERDVEQFIVSYIVTILVHTNKRFLISQINCPIRSIPVAVKCWQSHKPLCPHSTPDSLWRVWTALRISSFCFVIVICFGNKEI